MAGGEPAGVEPEAPVEPTPDDPGRHPDRQQRHQQRAPAASPRHRTCLVGHLAHPPRLAAHNRGQHRGGGSGQPGYPLTCSYRSSAAWRSSAWSTIGRGVAVRRAVGQLPRPVHRLAGDVAQLGHERAHVVAVRVELLALRDRVEDAEEGRGVGARAGDPLPAVLVGRQVAVDEVPHEVPGAPRPVQVQVLDEEARDDHAHPVVHPGLSRSWRIPASTIGKPVRPSAQAAKCASAAEPVSRAGGRTGRRSSPGRSPGGATARRRRTRATPARTRSVSAPSRSGRRGRPAASAGGRSRTSGAPTSATCPARSGRSRASL